MYRYTFFSGISFGFMGDTYFAVLGLSVTYFLSLLEYIKRKSAPFISPPTPTVTYDFAGAEKWKYGSEELEGTLSRKWCLVREGIMWRREG
jgi:hypothetical protein